MLNADTIKVKCHVPFDGDAVHFTLRPGHSEGGSPTDVRLEKSEIVFSLTAKVSNPRLVQGHVEGIARGRLDEPRCRRGGDRPFNDSVLTTVRDRIDLILADTQNADTFMANLGYPRSARSSLRWSTRQGSPDSASSLTHRRFAFRCRSAMKSSQ